MTSLLHIFILNFSPTFIFHLPLRAIKSRFAFVCQLRSDSADKSLQGKPFSSSSSSTTLFTNQQWTHLCSITELKPLLGRQKVTQNSSCFPYYIHQGVSHCQRWNLSSNHEKNYSPHRSGHANLKCEECHVHIKYFWALWIKSWCGERQLWSRRTPAGPETLSLLFCGWCWFSAHSQLSFKGENIHRAHPTCF